MGKTIFYLFHADLHAFLIKRIWALRVILIDNKIIHGKVWEFNIYCLSLEC